MLLVHASPTTLEPYRCPNLGVLSSPDRFYRNVEGWPWAADNGCFGEFDDDLFRTMLDRIAEIPDCLFVTAPDVVGDHAATLGRFGKWHGEMGEQPIAFVGQDGARPTTVPWSLFDVLFIGGSSEWKLGDEARELVTEAKRRGKWVHMGRVNTYQRIRYAKAIGCDSIDGTNFSRYRDLKLPGALKAVAAPAQGIFEVAV